MHIGLSDRGSINSNITCSIVNIRLSNGVDKSGVEGAVDEGGVGVGNVGGGVGQSIPRVSKGSIGEAIDEGSNGSSFVSWSGESHGGKGKQSEALHDDCQ